MKNMNQLMRQAKKMQEEILKAQASLAEQVVEGTAGGGAVKVRMNGHKDVVAVEIDKSVVSPDDVEMLQDLVLVAIQDASQKANDLAEQVMGKYTRGLNLPGMF
ncbi:MAG: YbaB/EbfC family nucleoid-associated protein [Alicyclobacillus mali]|uniref:YbaB/EbfC family nucleoid-associated protein n=1 Tax=Alicyclobacillus mali (ex Roth et al. 2021) TaxID=1123961 RepID=UPI001A8FEB50|nr:YbaB/EbfC family nucleoid-associated protein [Alicyclobacillus mali (ex Roth et al. 2021)]MCL6488930.1 YbaB/EbfC family nucleoid-associated protein [Alicyclobacillus mali (ex Roth et al. 2021)]